MHSRKVGQPCWIEGGGDTLMKTHGVQGNSGKQLIGYDSL